MTSRSERVLISGLSGFTGQHLAAELSRAGHEVFGFDSCASSLPHCLRGDLLDPASLSGIIDRVRPTAVIHLAGIAFAPHNTPDIAYRLHVTGTQNLLEALLGQDERVNSVVLASTAHVYGRPPESGIQDEALCPAPLTHYGISKLAMEHIARTYLDRLPVVIARPFNYTGPGQDEKFLVPKIVHHFKAKAPMIELGNTFVKRDFSDVRDVAAVYRTLMESAPPGTTVNICSGVPTALMDIVSELNRLAGYDIEVTVNPAFVRADDPPLIIGDRTRLDAIPNMPAPRPVGETLEAMLNA